MGLHSSGLSHEQVEMIRTADKMLMQARCHRVSVFERMMRPDGDICEIKEEKSRQAMRSAVDHSPFPDDC